MTEADRRRVQQALARMGYYVGATDGAFGPNTRAAIRRYQFELGTELTGTLTPAQAGRLLSVR
jgi:peptidoglycan hydrolase-like protein with peptidoglycan-binding domain